MLAARLPAEPLLQRMRGGVDGLHIPQREGEREGRRAVRQGRERVFPDEGRQQLHRIHRAGALLRQQQGGGGAVGQDVEAAVKQLQSPRCQQGRAGRAGRFAQSEEGFGLVGVDAPGRCLKVCPECGQRKHALAVQPMLEQQVKFGQRVFRVRLRHPEIRPGKMSSAHVIRLLGDSASSIVGGGPFGKQNHGL